MQPEHVSFPISKRPNQSATARGFVALVLSMLPPIAPSRGTPFSPIITIAISIYRVIGLVMIAFVGVATLAPSCASYAACAAARGAAVGALGSQPVVMIYRIPGTQVALFIEVGRG